MSKKDEKLLKKIEQLNTAYIAIRLALKSIKKLFIRDESVKHCLWRIDKELVRLHKYILKMLEDEIQTDTFNQIMKQMNGGKK